MKDSVRQHCAPAAGQGVLRARAEMLSGIRAFFAGRGVLEVETPCLSEAANPDPNMESLRLATHPPLYLHTSPEFAMKRMLAAGSGPIYQVTRVFRAGERSRWHNPEFTMLEWYRPGFELRAMMAETVALVRDRLGAVLDPAQPVELSWREAFRRFAGLDPETASDTRLRARVRELGLAEPGPRRDPWLDLLFAAAVAPGFPENSLVLITGFPPSQAALAKVSGQAMRFELFAGPMELANGYQELTDPAEHRARFGEWNALRRRDGRAPLPLDQRLLDAVDAGLPECCGVALGVDRLLMLRTGAACIDEVLAFPAGRA